MKLTFEAKCSFVGFILAFIFTYFTLWLSGWDIFSRNWKAGFWFVMASNLGCLGGIVGSRFPKCMMKDKNDS